MQVSGGDVFPKHVSFRLPGSTVHCVNDVFVDGCLRVHQLDIFHYGYTNIVVSGPKDKGGNEQHFHVIDVFPPHPRLGLPAFCNRAGLEMKSLNSMNVIVISSTAAAVSEFAHFSTLSESMSLYMRRVHPALIAFTSDA
jgi:hypothetical protein